LWRTWCHDQQATKRSYFLTHCAFIPPEDLQKQTSPFVDEALVQVNFHAQEWLETGYIMWFIYMLKRFGVLIFQDAAELIGINQAIKMAVKKSTTF
jgi:hypothetical protein